MAALDIGSGDEVIMADTNWIDTQKGREVACNTVGRNTVKLDVLGQIFETEHFVLEGDLDLELWYRGSDWVRLTFKGEDGSLIEYELLEFKPIDMSFA